MARKRLSENGKKQNITKYATWNVRGLANEEELGSVLNEKKIKIVAITASRKKVKCTKETNNFIVIYSGINRRT